MKLSIVNILIVFGLKLSANNVAAADAVGQTGLCTTDTTFERTDDVLGRYTCARIALEKAALGFFDCSDPAFFEDFYDPCPIECGMCAACADSDEVITGFKDDKKKCTFKSGKKKKKIKKYCRKNKNVLEACPLTCDNCESNAPTDSYVCEDTSFEFTYTAANDPTTVPFTCASLDKQYNAGTIDNACKIAEIKFKCPVLCDNCNSASPSVVSSAPSSKPSVSSTTCVDKKVKGIKIFYIRGKVVNGVETFPIPPGDMLRSNKKCKQLAKESKETIADACEDGKFVVSDGSLLADYCKLTCDNCGISAAPSTTVIEPECDDNDVNTWKYEGETVTCTDLRGKDELTQADICKKKNGAKTNCISTCNLCPE